MSIKPNGVAIETPRLHPEIRTAVLQYSNRLCRRSVCIIADEPLNGTGMKKIVLSVFCLLLAAGAFAAPPKGNTVPDESFAKAVKQADGITEGVVDRMWLNSDHFWHQGDYYRIIALLRLVAEADPGYTEAFSNGAYLLWSMGDVNAADDFLRHGLNTAPDALRWEMNYNVGHMLFQYRKDYKGALPYLQRAVLHNGAPVTAWTLLAHCYERAGRLTQSASTWRTVTERFPNFGAGFTNLHRIQAKLKPHGTGA